MKGSAKPFLFFFEVFVFLLFLFSGHVGANDFYYLYVGGNTSSPISIIQERTTKDSKTIIVDTVDYKNLPKAEVTIEKFQSLLSADETAPFEKTLLAIAYASAYLGQMIGVECVTTNEEIVVKVRVSSMGVIPVAQSQKVFVKKMVSEDEPLIKIYESVFGLKENTNPLFNAQEKSTKELPNLGWYECSRILLAIKNLPEQKGNVIQESQYADLDTSFLDGSYPSHEFLVESILDGTDIWHSIGFLSILKIPKETYLAIAKQRGGFVADSELVNRSPVLSKTMMKRTKMAGLAIDDSPSAARKIMMRRLDKKQKEKLFRARAQLKGSKQDLKESKRELMNSKALLDEVSTSQIDQEFKKHAQEMLEHLRGELVRQREECDDKKEELAQKEYEFDDLKKKV